MLRVTCNIGLFLTNSVVLLLNVYFFFTVSFCPVRDLVSSQRAVSTSNTPSRNFFSTFLPQGRRTPGKPPQVTTGSSPSQVAVGRKEPPISQVKACWSSSAKLKSINFLERRAYQLPNSQITKPSVLPSWLGVWKSSFQMFWLNMSGAAAPLMPTRCYSKKNSTEVNEGK